MKKGWGLMGDILWLELLLWAPLSVLLLLRWQEGHPAGKNLSQLPHSLSFMGPDHAWSNTRKEGWTRKCQSSLLSDQNIRWPHGMLPPSESRWVLTGQTDGCQTVIIRFPLDATSRITEWQYLICFQKLKHCRCCIVSSCVIVFVWCRELAL